MGFEYNEEQCSNKTNIESNINVENNDTKKCEQPGQSIELIFFENCPEILYIQDFFNQSNHNQCSQNALFKINNKIIISKSFKN